MDFDHPMQHSRPDNKGYIRRLLKPFTASLIVLAAVFLGVKYWILKWKPVNLSGPPITNSPALNPPAAIPSEGPAVEPGTAAQPKDPSPAIAVPPTTATASGPATPEEELAPFREPRFERLMNVYTRNIAAYAKLQYVPIDPNVSIADLTKVLRPVIDRQIQQDEQSTSLIRQHGDIVPALTRHLAVVLLRLSGLDAGHYLQATAEARNNRLYVPESVAQYRLAFSTLLKDVPVAGDNDDQEGLARIFNRLSELQLQGRSAANNQITGWNDDPHVVRLRMTEVHGTDIDSGILKLTSRDDHSTRQYYGGGILLGSMIFTTPTPTPDADRLLVIFDTVVRTSNDFYTVRICSCYDATSNAWHLAELTRGVSPRPSQSNPMVF